MQTNSVNKLIAILKNKEINFEYGMQSLFKKYSYYQLINAYKNLFISDAESINKIKQNILAGNRILLYRKAFNISSDVSDAQLYEKICEKICSKYGIKISNLNENEKNIIQHIRYHHHIYNPNTQYSDFVRMYKFEHELRMVLLKYLLIIEESMKNIFISYLNDKPAPANYLSNMDSYNTSFIGNNSFNTLKLMIDKYDNRKSKPVKRKREQNLTVPYWILINELAMNQTYYAIVNLNETDSDSIFLRCVNYFTKLNIKEENRGKTQVQIALEKKQINTFKSILCYLGEFRNMLAHNQPIYCYNVSKYDIGSNPKFEYELPKTKNNMKDRNGNTVTSAQQQININGDLMHKLADFYGSDSFNSNNSTKLDLSKIIYILYKALKTIDDNTLFYDELYNVYVKYNIIITEVRYELTNPLKYNELLEEISKLNSCRLESQAIINKIENGQSYKKQIKSFDSEYEKIKKIINKKSEYIKLNEIRSKYRIFPSIRRYEEFTGIDLNFFKNIK